MLPAPRPRTPTLDPFARLALKLSMLVRNPPGRRKAMVLLVALLAALAIGGIDRGFGLTEKRQPGAGTGHLLRLP